jgi:hypothetical protein
VRTLFGTFKLGCWLYAVLSVVITLVVLAILAKHSPEIATPPPFP